MNAGQGRGSGRQLAIGLALLGAVSLAQLLACDAFTPRDPEEPGEVQPIVLLTHPDSVYVSLQLGISSKFINTYMNTLDEDDFIFHPDLQDSTSMVRDNPGLFDDWNWRVEERAHSSIFGRYDSLNLTFVGEAEIWQETDELLYLRHEYVLKADQRTFKGLLDWIITRKQGEWRISTWWDTRIDTSWTVLRGENR